MTNWRLVNRTWCLWPSRPKALIEMIGGSYLSASPHISYKRLLEGLFNKNIAIHSWSYLPGFDHQKQSNEAWKEFRNCRKKLEMRVGESTKIIRLGHSLGCKLHLLAPDGGRSISGLISISFNNFTAKESIPMLSKLTKDSGKYKEFNPSPNETMRLINQRYIQSRNLLISFKNDELDETNKLLSCLREREGNDESSSIKLSGDHLTPVSFGLRQNLLGKWSNDKKKSESIKIIINTINDWAFLTSSS